MQCAHGDAVEYSVATVEINVQGRVITVEAAVVHRQTATCHAFRDRRSTVGDWVEEEGRGSYGCN